VEDEGPGGGGKDQSARGQGSGSETSGVAKLGRRREDRRATGSALSHRNDLGTGHGSVWSVRLGPDCANDCQGREGPSQKCAEAGHAEALNSQR